MTGLLQPAHLLLVFVVLLIVFGPRRLPHLGRSAGAAIRAFRAGARDEDDGPPDTAPAARPAGEPSSHVDQHRAP
ncbi:sec-independent protein translocase protein TatA [Deinococcus metalli]|uniref:Sec-independent protein translocase protein TatA n=1 Tax=Deinococcus metalli TaxID=1141878 RepID=A0A7W8KGU9_9DEIO|nr:twin-arginine translocase TatA/TatE family subunit [Deinococcus metalli]MBB5377548.1 sec-independent protein translocase protein TatA [Deinococcus metalli]GHF51282.1 hypothetical protein GCM10017781_29770 [Deinococcus metalli]